MYYNSLRNLFFGCLLFVVIFLFSVWIFRRSSGSGGHVAAGPTLCCLVLTVPGDVATKARSVEMTWARRCDQRFFYFARPTAAAAGSAPNRAGYVPLDVPEGRAHLTAHTMHAFRHARRAVGHKCEWFMKADDDTYVVVENLKSYLSGFDSSRDHYVGHRSLDLLPNGYNGGGAGYVLSRPAVDRMLASPTCKRDGAIEDLDVGDCMHKLGVLPVDTTDADGRLRFHFDLPEKVIGGQGDARKVMFYRKIDEDFRIGNPKAHHVMSPRAVSFHRVDPARMFMFDYLLYDLRLSGS